MNLYRMTIVLHYKDRTKSHLTLTVPDKVADEIQLLGLTFTTVTIDRIIQVPTAGNNAIFDDYKKGG